MPVVLMVSSSGKQAFLKEPRCRDRGVPEGAGSPCACRTSAGPARPGQATARPAVRASISQTELILGQTVMGSQLRDLRSVIRWLRARKDIDPGKGRGATRSPG